jgi:hypothetical protein
MLRTATASPSSEKEHLPSTATPIYEDIRGAATESSLATGLHPLGRLVSRGRPASSLSLANIGLCVMILILLKLQCSELMGGTRG